jgi:hypothetical protein
VWLSELVAPVKANAAAGAIERHPSASAGVRSPRGDRGLRAVGPGRVRAGTREGRRGAAWAWLRPVGPKWSARPVSKNKSFSNLFSENSNNFTFLSNKNPFS